MNVSAVRAILKDKLEREEFVIDKTGVKTVEIVGASFVADEPSIFGTPNEDYIKREMAWYESMSLNVNDIPPPVPVIWQKCATPDGRINSNYGWCVWSDENHKQYVSCFKELKKNPDSRRGTMIYTRPSMQFEYNKDGMSDFMCTFATQHLIRNDKLVTIVMMRSNDAWAGYRNDYAWQETVHCTLATDLGVEPGDILWQVGSLHIYEPQFYLIDHYGKTGETTISKSEYDEKYLQK